jgi:hypothetical protein
LQWPSDKNHRLIAGDFEPSPAPGVRAGQGIIHPHHIVASFGEFCPILFVRSRRKSFLFRPAHPADIEFGGLAALGAKVADSLDFETFRIKVSLIHDSILTSNGKTIPLKFSP